MPEPGSGLSSLAVLEEHTPEGQTAFPTVTRGSLTVYIDESGTTRGTTENPHKHWLVFGACLLDIHGQSSVQSALSKSLEEFGVVGNTELHATEIRNAVGAFSRLTSQQTLALVERLAMEICSLVGLFASAVDTASWTIRDLSHPPLEEMAFNLLLPTIGALAREAGETIEVMFDNAGSRSNRRRSELFERSLSNLSLSSVSPDLRFGDSSENVGLQLADMYAYSVWRGREMNDRLWASSLEPATAPVRRLGIDPVAEFSVGIEEYLAIIEGMDRREREAYE